MGLQDDEGHVLGADKDAARRQRMMTRESLYSLVWETPMSRLAKRFGISDVGLRKICVRHDIPTPPLGYWAKRAHGKPVKQPPLPSNSEKESYRIHLVEVPSSPPEVAAEMESVLSRELAFPKVVVPEERPARLHPVASATAKALRTAKRDSEGFKHARTRGGVETKVGPDSIDRTLRIIDAFLRATEQRGYGIKQDEDGVCVVVDEVPMEWQIYAIKDRIEHQPTNEELRAQKRHEEDRARWPSSYASRAETKVYRTWDYRPSNRLAMRFVDGTRYGWGRDKIVGHWCDRKTKKLEDYLDAAMAALATGAIAINHRLALEAEEARRKAQELEQRRREHAKRERELRRHEFLLKKSKEYLRYERLSAFAEFMDRSVYQYSNEPIDQLIVELRELVNVLGQGFEREALQDEISRLQLYMDEGAFDDGPND